MAKGSFKRAVWCRWAHRYRMPRDSHPVVTWDPPGRVGIRMSAGPSRSCCDACSETGPGWPSQQRIMDRWLAS